MKKAIAITLADIKAGNFEAVRNAGLQPLTADDLQQLAQDSKDHEEYMATEGYKDSRRAEYPGIGDQLDAVLKALNFLQLNGINMPTETDAIINQWLAVKAKYPKPEKVK